MMKRLNISLLCVSVAVFTFIGCSQQNNTETKSEILSRLTWPTEWGKDTVLTQSELNTIVQGMADDGIPLILTVKRQKSDMKLNIYENGVFLKSYVTSLGMVGHLTPTGFFNVDYRDKNKRSSLYNNAYMGYAMQINGNIFIHASHDIVDGKLRSHGCVRLKEANAKDLWNIITKHGSKNVRVIIYQ